jgi:hypothetical protein
MTSSTSVKGIGRTHAQQQKSHDLSSFAFFVVVGDIQ